MFDASARWGNFVNAAVISKEWCENGNFKIHRIKRLSVDNNVDRKIFIHFRAENAVFKFMQISVDRIEVSQYPFSQLIFLI